MQHANNDGWALDVQSITTTVLTTTGGTVWSAANRCRDFLETMAAEVGLHRQGVRVLELGAGCGTLGLTLARNLPLATEVCLTEQAYGCALQHLQRNVAANSHLPNMGTVTCCACDWTHFMDTALLEAAAHASTGAPTAAAGTGSAATPTGPPCTRERESPGRHQQQQQLLLLQGHDQQLQEGHDQQEQQGSEQQAAAAAASYVSGSELHDLHKLLTTPWDIIVGSDLVYNTAGANALPRVLATLMKPQTHPKAGCTHNPQQDQGACSSYCNDSHNSSSLQQGCIATDAACSVAKQQCGQNSMQQHRCSCGGAEGGPVMYYAHTKHRYDAIDVLLFEQLAAEGLTVQEVVEMGKELPPPSPPPFSSLFPDMRCAVFKIYYRAH